ncbi:hypothetical protein [Bifidobacterium pseudolongum]|uniref:Uncharacterized protein n=1 Tax=Bifidobacterium pseudolongum subsp. globosum TaxID=1690 RepID=A0A2N3QVR5_9BIFI|nr:hypothetical protein [Bifidobacterium pseudolongum]PKU96220.1 hypothetical protein CQR45_0342 [Bifidobacterium pseudolongum subsp. globosum]
MAVTGKKVGRLDIRLVRGDTQRVGGRWRKRNLQTGEITPVDLSAWAGTLELRSPDGGDVWYSAVCTTMTTDGYAICDIPANAFTGDQWQTRRTGQWKVTVRHPLTGERRTIGWGYWTLSD